MGQRERAKLARRNRSVIYQGEFTSDGEALVKEVQPVAVSGWLIWVKVAGEWQLFKFTTIKKRKRVAQIVKALRQSYNLEFRYETGWTTQKEQPNEDKSKTGTAQETNEQRDEGVAESLVFDEPTQPFTQEQWASLSKQNP